MSIFNDSMHYYVNGRLCYYNNPTHAIRKALERNINIYCILKERVAGIYLGHIIEIVGDYNTISLNDPVRQMERRNDQLPAREFINLTELIDTLKEMQNTTGYDDALFDNLAHALEKIRWMRIQPIKSNGEEMTLEEFMTLNFFEIKHPAYDAYNGRYCSEQVAMLACYFYGSKEIFNRYCRELMLFYGDRLFTEYLGDDILYIQSVMSELCN